LFKTQEQHAGGKAGGQIDPLLSAHRPRWRGNCPRRDAGLPLAIGRCRSLPGIGGVGNRFAWPAAGCHSVLIHFFLEF
jgi:hypothetical protein